MQLAMMGLGKMGANMALRLHRGGHDCIGFDVREEAVAELRKTGMRGTTSLDELKAMLQPPRTAWMMVPAGEVTDALVRDLTARLEPGDVIVDGGNSYFKDDVRRAAAAQQHGLHYVDVGTSGGVWGLARGYCLMYGGDAAVVERLVPVFRTLAPGFGTIERTSGREKRPSTAEEGFHHCGPVGSGHFVKMIHNGVEYGLMQAFAEGLDIMRGAAAVSVPEEHRFDIDLAEVTELWRRGSVVSSWLLDLAAAAFLEDPTLAAYTGFVQDSGEGRWTIQAAIEEAVPAHVLTSALYARFRSRQDHAFADKVLSAMRKGFGGHLEQAPPPGRA